jgi:uncharacterized membrane protein YqjE
MRLLSLSRIFGITSRLRRLRILMGEGALAVEDRAELLRFAWEDEKRRLQWMLGLVIAVVGLTTITAALLSVAIVIHFWDTPYRSVAAWWAAAVWAVLWLASLVALVSMKGKSSATFESVRREFDRDREWLGRSLGRGGARGAQSAQSAVAREARLRSVTTREDLLARIEKQRARIATLEAAASHEGEAPAPGASASGMVMRLARQHPVVAGIAAAAAVAVLGPRRIVRWAGVVVPVLWRMR